MTMRSQIRRGALVLAVVLAAGSMLTAPAQASDNNWTWKDSDGKVAEAQYRDSGNKVAIWDRRSDGHSAVLVIWRPAYPDTRAECWDTNGGGFGSSGHQCILSIGTEDGQLYARMCTGEAASQTLVRCDNSTYTFYK